MAVGEPWERVSVDITGPHPVSKHGNKFILTAIDNYTKWAEAWPIRQHEATTVARILADQWFARFGIPVQLLSDQGAEFEGTLMKELCRVLEIDKLRTTAYKASTNGAIERFHRTLNSMLGKVVATHQRDWDEHLSSVLMAYRASKHEATGYTPNRLVLGSDVRLPLDLAFGSAEEERKAQRSYNEFVQQRQDTMRESFEVARQHLGTAAERSKHYYDLRVRPRALSRGQWVWYYYPRRISGRSPKWQKMSTGPFLIVKTIGPVNYLIQKGPRAKPMVVHRDKLKECLSKTPASWITEEAEPQVSERLTAAPEPLLDPSVGGEAGVASRPLVAVQDIDHEATVDEDDDEQVTHSKRQDSEGLQDLSPELDPFEEGTAEFDEEAVVGADEETAPPLAEVDPGAGFLNEEVSLAVRPKRNAPRPRRFLSRVEAVQCGSANYGDPRQDATSVASIRVRPPPVRHLRWIFEDGLRVRASRLTDCAEQDEAETTDDVLTEAEWKDLLRRAQTLLAMQ